MILNLRHEVTLARALRSVVRWAWLVPLCAAAFAGLAHVVTANQSETYFATVRLHALDTVVSYNREGFPIPTSLIYRNAAEVPVDDFELVDVARDALEKLDGPTSKPTEKEFLARLLVKPVTATDIELSYSDSSAQRAAALLAAYATEVVAWKRTTQLRALERAKTDIAESLDTLPASTSAANIARRIELTSAIDRLDTAIKLLPEQVATVAPVTLTRSEPGFPPHLATAGGGVGGAAAGFLLALLLGRFDRRVRRASDIRLPRGDVLEVDSRRRTETLHHLRSRLELAGLGSRVQTAAVMSATRGEGPSSVAYQLSRAFAESGTQTVLVSADLRGGERPPTVDGNWPKPQHGVSTFLAGSDILLANVALTEDLLWVAPGSDAGDEAAAYSTAKIKDLLMAAQLLGDIAIVDAPPAEDPEGVLFVGACDLTVLVVNRSRSRWTGVAAALELIGGAASRPIIMCFDRARRRSRNHVAKRGHARAALAERSIAADR
jgi:Mrp family chromosome partitioning ATPase